MVFVVDKTAQLRKFFLIVLFLMLMESILFSGIKVLEDEIVGTYMNYRRAKYCCDISLSSNVCHC